MQIRLYGRLADAIGRDVAVEMPTACSVGEVRCRLESEHPAIASALGHARAVIDDHFVPDDTKVERSLIEFLPPVSGG